MIIMINYNYCYNCSFLTEVLSENSEADYQANTRRPNVAQPIARGWRTTAGNLIDILWLTKSNHEPQCTGHMPETQRGYGLIEFEISNSTISTVFRQPLILQHNLSWTQCEIESRCLALAKFQRRPWCPHHP